MGVARFVALTAVVAVGAAPAPAHQRLVYSTDGNITVYDTATGRSAVVFRRAAGQAQGGGSPRWSSDGKQIVLAGNRAELLVIRPDGPAPRRLVRGNTYPAGWSSDGRWIAYQTSFGVDAGDLRIVREDGTHAHRISTATSMHPVWVPGTHRMLVGRAVNVTVGAARGFAHDIVAVGAGAKLAVVPHSGDAEDPAVSRDGKWVAFTKNDRIWVERLNGTGLHAVTASSKQHYDREPSWSPDGRRLSLTRVYYGEPGTDYFAGIMIVNVDGSDERPLADQRAGSDSDSVWSPDGSFISFQRLDISGGGVGLMVVGLRTGRAHLLGFFDQDTRPDWSPAAGPRTA